MGGKNDKEERYSFCIYGDCLLKKENIHRFKMKFIENVLCSVLTHGRVTLHLLKLSIN